MKYSACPRLRIDCKPRRKLKKLRESVFQCQVLRLNKAINLQNNNSYLTAHEPL